MQRMQVCFRFACELIYMSKNTFFTVWNVKTAENHKEGAFREPDISAGASPPWCHAL